MTPPRTLPDKRRVTSKSKTSLSPELRRMTAPETRNRTEKDALGVLTTLAEIDNLDIFELTKLASAAAKRNIESSVVRDLVSQLLWDAFYASSPGFRRSATLAHDAKSWRERERERLQSVKAIVEDINTQLVEIELSRDKWSIEGLDETEDALFPVSSPGPRQDRALAPDPEEPHPSGNYFLPGDIEAQIEAFVEHCNHRRYHESFNNMTPADAYFSRAETIIRQRERIKRQTIELRRLLHRKRAA